MFTFGSTAPVFDLLDATLKATAIAPGEAVDVTLSIANHGGVTGTFTGTIIANCEPIADTILDVAAFGENTTTRSIGFDELGAYELTLEGEVIGTVLVQAEQMTESSPALTPTQPNNR